MAFGMSIVGPTGYEMVTPDTPGGSLYIGARTVDAGVDQTFTFTEIPGGQYLKVLQVGAGNHTSVIGTDANGNATLTVTKGPIRTTYNSVGTALTFSGNQSVFLIFATNTNEPDPFGLRLFNSSGERLISTTRPTPEFLGKIPASDWSLNYTAATQSTYTMYNYTAATNLGLGRKIMILWNLPSTTGDTWYASTGNEQGAINPYIASWQVQLYVYSTTSTFGLPEAFVFGLDEIPISNTGQGLRCFDSSSKVTYDSNRNHLFLNKVTEVGYPSIAAPGTINTYNEVCTSSIVNPLFYLPEYSEQIFHKMGRNGHSEDYYRGAIRRTLNTAYTQTIYEDYIEDFEELINTTIVFINGEYTNIVLPVADGAPFGATTLSSNIQQVTIGIHPSEIANYEIGVAYSQQLSASGGTATYTYSVQSGSFPSGISLNSSGLISGTPAAGTTGQYTVLIKATDATGLTGTRSYVNNCTAPVVITITPTAPPSGYVGSAYSQQLTASGGTAPYTFVPVTTTYPPGITMNSSGLISGTPTNTGTYYFNVIAVDAANKQSASIQITIVIAAAPSVVISPSSLGAVYATKAYSQTFTGSGGTAPYTVSLYSGTLPTGLTLSSNTLSGTPTTAGTYSFTLKVADANGFYSTNAYSFTINPVPTISLTPTTLGSAVVNVAYTQTFTASGGTAPYTFSVSGTFPPGISGNPSTGTLSGTPTSTGTYNFTITATDANGFTGSRAYSLVITAPTLSISPGALSAGTVTLAYNQTFTTSGGSSPYTYTVTSGTLPTGITLSSSGVLSGTCNTAGTYSFTIKSTDNAGYNTSTAYSLTINAAPTITVSPTSISNPTGSNAYSQTFTASGGSGSYTYSYSGTIPTGLSLSSAGVLSGTPTIAGAYSFTITAKDSNNFTGSRSYSVTVAAPVFTIGPSNTTISWEVGVSAFQQFTVTGGQAPYTYYVVQPGSAVPGGISVNGVAGTLSGTPTTSGSYQFILGVQDANGFVTQKTYTINVAAGHTTTTTWGGSTSVSNSLDTESGLDVTFDSNGQVTRHYTAFGGDFDSITNNWFTPTTAAIGNSYWIRFTRTSPSSPPAGTTATNSTGWLSLASPQTFSIFASYNAATNKPRSITATYTVEISTNSSGTNIVVSTTMTVQAIGNAA